MFRARAGKESNVFAIVNRAAEIRSIDVRREEPGQRPSVWVRTGEGVTFCLPMEEVPWLAGAFGKAYEEAKAAAPDATGVLFEMERGQAEAEATEVG